MTGPLERLRRAFNIKELPGASGFTVAWHVSCPRCSERWSVPVKAHQPDPTFVARLHEHSSGHEEVTRRVRLVRGRP